MIIEFQVFSKDYFEKILNFDGFFEYICPKCGARKRFYRHGTYCRWITYLSEKGSIIFESLKILRLKCRSCHSTHSILPCDIIPFQIYSLPVVLFLCGQVLAQKQSLRKTAKKTNSSIQTIYQKLGLLIRSLDLIELYLRQESLYTEAAPLSLGKGLGFLLLPAMKFSAYFHCHGHPLFLHRRNTDSYHIYMAAAFS